MLSWKERSSEALLISCISPNTRAPLFLHVFQQRHAGTVLYGHAKSTNIVTAPFCWYDRIQDFAPGSDQRNQWSRLFRLTCSPYHRKYGMGACIGRQPWRDHCKVAHFSCCTGSQTRNVCLGKDLGAGKASWRVRSLFIRHRHRNAQAWYRLQLSSDPCPCLTFHSVIQYGVFERSS